MNKALCMRTIYFSAALITIGLGLLSRASFLDMPEFVHLYVGDALWALMVYWLVCTLKPNWDAKFRFIAALSFAFTIEFSQLYQADWINEIRNTTLGALVLGFGFKASDLAAYLIGVTLGHLINQKLIVKYLK